MRSRSRGTRRRPQPNPARKPHTPILLGGYSDAVLERVGRHCQGWLPAYAGTKLLSLTESDTTGPEHVRQGRAKIMAHYGRFMMDTLLRHPSVQDCKTSFVMDQVKATTALPV